MARTISPGTVWDEAQRFCRAEAALLAPVAALGFGLPLVVLLLAVPADQAASGRLTPGPWALWLLPCGLMSMTGTLAVSAMALRPGATVGECLRVAAARVPAGIGLNLLFAGFQLLLSLPLAAIARIEVARGGAPGVLALLGEVATLAVLVWLFVRVMPIWALLSERPAGPVATLRATFAATRGRYRLLLPVRFVGGLAGVAALAVTLIPLGAVSALVGALTGATAAAGVLSFVLSGAAFAAIMTVWTVYVARLYRRLADGI